MLNRSKWHDPVWSVAKWLCSKILALWWLLPILAMAGVFYAFYLGLVPIKGSTFEERGQYGDSFGVLNSLFTGLGFGGIIVTLILQQRQLRQQDAQIRIERQADALRHYEDTLHRLLGLYRQALAEVVSNSGHLVGRDLLRGCTSRAFEAIKHERVQLIPPDIQTRRGEKILTNADQLLLDYLYFRNFKILTVEMDRQGRLIKTLIALLRHLVEGVPSHVDPQPFKALVCAQITYIEVSYYFLISLAFSGEIELRFFLLKSGLLQKAGNIKRLKIHDYMYEHFWGVDVRSFKEKTTLPMSMKRIDAAVRAYRSAKGEAGTPLTVYRSPRSGLPKGSSPRPSTI